MKTISDSKYVYIKIVKYNSLGIGVSGCILQV